MQDLFRHLVKLVLDKPFIGVVKTTDMSYRKYLASYFARIGRKGGRARSQAKVAAGRRNLVRARAVKNGRKHEQRRSERGIGQTQRAD